MEYKLGVHISGEKLRSLRGARKATSVAAAIGTTRQNLCNWEKGRAISAQALACLLLYYRAKIEDVVVLEDNQANT